MIPHSRPTISKEDVSSVADNLISGQIASGKETTLFVEEMSKFIGVRGGIVTNSGTNALHLALKAIGIKTGDEVVLPSYVCASVQNAVNYTGATPVLADIESDEYNIDPESVEKKISKKTKAIIVPHMFGTPANLGKLLTLGVPIIEDCAQAIGAKYGGKRVGSLGDLSVFSFYATKILTTGQGGMVLTNSPKLLENLANLTKYDELKEYGIAYNYELADFSAALGRNQLKRLDSFIKKRNEIAKIYDGVFEQIGKKGRISRKGICFRYVVEVDNPDRFIDAMKKCGVNCAKPVFKPLHQYFEAKPQKLRAKRDDLDSNKSKEFPNTERAMNRAVSIPVYPSLTDSEIAQILDAIKEACK